MYRSRKGEIGFEIICSSRYRHKLKSSQEFRSLVKSESDQTSLFTLPLGSRITKEKSEDVTQIAILICSKFDTARELEKQVDANELVIKRQTCRVTLITNYSKNSTQTNVGFESPTTHFILSLLSHSASWILRGEDRFR
ncbi:hypothetical protein AVEN_112553-1 [Araneus ventricosus]|uniref:Uncharacterized protein n=1 Tax=Araneus ventricosus TaxID=182803 RepID=A0A4Y2K3X2_ARAVE|nr:hypothetical protein AVEN_112553-1 [Araneus ventricosus]